MKRRRGLDLGKCSQCGKEVEGLRGQLREIADAHEKSLDLILNSKDGVGPNATALRLQTLTETTLEKLRALAGSSGGTQ